MGDKMRINNKGFAISGVLYPIFILFIALIFGVVGILASSKALLDKVTSEIEMELNGEDLNPALTMVGSNISLAPNFVFNIYEGIESFSYDGKDIGTDNISYVIYPELSVNSNNEINTSIPGIYNIVYTALDSRGRSISQTRTIEIGEIVNDFSYTGSAQTYEAFPKDILQFELWGAEGGGSAGHGGYVKGNLEYSSLEAPMPLYIYVGQEGLPGTPGVAATSTVGQGGAATFNGGGQGGNAGGGAYPYENYSGGSAGGGATDIRTYNNKFRYVRDFINGSTSNAGNHWVEIEVYSGGVNVALNKSITSLTPSAVDRPISRITDGDTDYNNYTSHGTGLQWVEIDLGAEYEISHVIIWHYYNGGRSYYNTKTVLIDETRTFEYPLFDSDYASIYPETSSGMQHNTNYWRTPGGLINRIMVAGGGGGASTGDVTYDLDQSHGGGLIGQLGAASAYMAGTYEHHIPMRGVGGTQTTGFLFGTGGVGADTGSPTYCNGHSGGGGGYYGGTGGQATGGSCHNMGGGGGSSFISGHTGSNAVSATGVHTSQPNHYSGLVFTETAMLGGNETMPNPSGGTEVGHSGNGYARITVLKRINE